MKNKNKKSVKSYINSLLIGLICCTPILTIVLSIIGKSTQNSTYYIWSTAIYPILGIIAIPNIIKHALKDNELDEIEMNLKILNVLESNKKKL